MDAMRRRGGVIFVAEPGGNWPWARIFLWAFLAFVASFAESFGFSASCSISSSFGAGVEVRVAGSVETAGRTISGKCSGFGVGASNGEGAATLRTMEAGGDMDL